MQAMVICGLKVDGDCFNENDGRKLYLSNSRFFNFILMYLVDIKRYRILIYSHRFVQIH